MTVMNEVLQHESVVTLTESAANQVRHLQSLDENAGKRLRVYVEQGGCSGMQYGMVFDERREDDVTAEFGGVPVLVDPFSAKYLAGAVIDFKDELTGGGFKITNPNAKQSSGCGNSFET